MRFDRVITNPPFSQNYSDEGMKFPERFRYGWCPESGKKADLMFVQHMLAVLRPGGMMATVMPHGVLFRGGARRTSAQGFIEDDLLEAVIGLPPNLFYGTGIPACILVLRAKGAKPKAERQGKVLFINADAEYRAGRAQNYLRPEHIEKIVSTLRRFADMPGFAAVVSHDDLAANDYNLNIRRYADNAPPPEPHDVRAHLLGGVPKAEVEANAPCSRPTASTPAGLVNARRALLRLRARLKDRGQIKTTIEADAGRAAEGDRAGRSLRQVVGAPAERLAGLPETKDLMIVRAELLKSFESAMVPVGVLDQFKVSGVIASWLSDALYDLKALASQGFDGLVDGWIAAIRSAFEDNKAALPRPAGPQTGREPAARLLEELADAQGKKAEMDGQLEAAKPPRR